MCTVLCATVRCATAQLRYCATALQLTTYNCAAHQETQSGYEMNQIGTMGRIIDTLKYRINGGGGNNRGGLEMVRDNNNRGVGIIGGGAAWRNRKQPFS